MITWRGRLRLPFRLHLQLVPSAPSVSVAPHHFLNTLQQLHAGKEQLLPLSAHFGTTDDRQSTSSRETLTSRCCRTPQVREGGVPRDGAPPLIPSTADLWSDFWGISDISGFKTMASCESSDGVHAVLGFSTLDEDFDGAGGGLSGAGIFVGTEHGPE